jgi:hypothetical protein
MDSNGELVNLPCRCVRNNVHAKRTRSKLRIFGAILAFVLPQEFQHEIRPRDVGVHVHQRLNLASNHHQQ